jgi:hypothetical protein
MRARERHRLVVQPLVARYGGQWIEETGDESLSCFRSALEAVNCALAIQGALRDDRDLRLRIGIHLGDVVFDKSRVYGDGVNVASRIRPLAEPGGICISGEVHPSIRNQPSIEVTPLGEHDLKNVGRPMSIFSLRGSPAAPAAVGESRKRWRRVGFAGAAVLLAVVAVIGIVPDLRVRVTAAALLRIPRLLPSTVEQEIGFTHSSDGTRIAYATLGSGPPLVQVLPEGMSHLELGPFSPTYAGRTLERLGSRHLLVRYDGRGFGLSQRGVQHSHEARVADLEAVVRAAWS